MRRVGLSPYGTSKAALGSETIIWAQDLAGIGVTVNTPLSGGATETGLIPLSGSPETRAACSPPPAIVVPPPVWLAPDASSELNGRRVDAKRWQSDIPLGDAA